MLVTIRKNTVVWVCLIGCLVWTSGFVSWSGGPVLTQAAGDPLVELVGTLPSELGQPTLSPTNLNQPSPGEVAVVLKPRQATVLETLINQVQNPQSVSFHRFLSQAELINRFSPEQVVQNAAKNYFRAKGLTIVYQSGDGLLFTLSGTAQQLDNAFNTTSDYRQNERGQQGRINLKPLRLPASLAGNVQAIAGFDTLHQPHINAKIGKTSPALKADGPVEATGLTPAQLRTIYNINSLGLDGSGTSVGLTLWGGPGRDELTDWSTYFGHPLNLTVLGNNDPAGTTNPYLRAEANLDVEQVQVAAYNTAIRYYVSSGPFDGSLLGVIAQAINDNVNALSNSWGECDRDITDSARAAYHAIFQIAAVKGIPVFISSGDSGVFECNYPSDISSVGYSTFPNSDPLVTSVGGTTLYRNSDNTWADERAWSCPTPDFYCLQGYLGSTGGGNGVKTPRPAYQTQVALPALPARFTNQIPNQRLQPDLSMNGDPATGLPLFLKGAGCTYSPTTLPNCTNGGTSASSPLMAGVLALAAQKANAYIGSINDFVYSQPSTATWLYDVIQGYNGVDATPGWDFTTGRGALKDVTAFINTLTTAPTNARPFVTARSFQFDDTSGNNNGAVEPGETVRLKVGLYNGGKLAATGVTATLSVVSGAANVTTSSSTYANIAPSATVLNSTDYVLQIDPAQPCGSSLQLQLTVDFNGNLSYVYPFSVPLGTRQPSAPAIYAYNGPAQTIPDNTQSSNLTIPITVTASGLVAEVNVKLNITHPRDSDVAAALESPAGTQVVLIAFEGDNGVNFTDTELDDKAANYLEKGSAPFTGSYRPEELLSALNGEAVSGTWRLVVYDYAAGKVGQVNNWSVQITPAIYACGPAITALSPASKLAGSGGFALNVTGTGFGSNSQVYWNGTSRPTTYNSSTSLSATIKTSDVLTPGVVSVTVVSTSPAGTSGSFPFYVLEDSCSQPTSVSKITDDGSCGTLRNALYNAATSNSKAVTFNSPPTTPITIYLNSGLTVESGVTLTGSCGKVTLNGNGLPGDGLIIKGATVTGIEVAGFLGRQIVVPSGHNWLNCVQASHP